MTELGIFLSGFAVVFFLGLQSQIVNHGKVVWAFFTSVMIGAMNLVMFKYVPDANVTEMIAYIMSGPCGIVVSIYAFRWIKQKQLWERI
jgi:hypothetical protein